MHETPDRIEKRVHLKAPRSKVWRAISDSKEFGAWFGVALTTPFAVGKTCSGHITEPAGYEHLIADFEITAIEPERYFAYRWHPYAIDPKVDYSNEPTTLVEFTLSDEGTGTLLVIVETGFSKIPAARRVDAFRMNDAGWTEQGERVARYVEK